jgi:Flp pilus assembly protein TadG
MTVIETLHDGERGGAAVETVLLTPVLIVLLLFVVFVGRISTARQGVDAAARDAARVASIHDDPEAARRAAEDVASASLAAQSLSCSQRALTVDTSDLRPGGAVHVQLTCSVALADLSQLGIPGTKTVTAEATAVVDRYRSEP